MRGFSCWISVDQHVQFRLMDLQWTWQQTTDTNPISIPYPNAMFPFPWTECASSSMDSSEFRLNVSQRFDWVSCRQLFTHKTQNSIYKIWFEILLANCCVAINSNFDDFDAVDGIDEGFRFDFVSWNRMKRNWYSWWMDALRLRSWQRNRIPETASITTFNPFWWPWLVVDNVNVLHYLDEKWFQHRIESNRNIY